MNNTNIVTLSLVLFANFLPAQKVCESNENVLEDLNSITKCTINKTEKVNISGKRTKSLSVKISSSTRYLKRRVKSRASGVNNLNSSGISQSNSKSNISESLNFLEEKPEGINKLMSNLSNDKLEKASEFEDVNQIPLFKSCKATNKKNNLKCFNEKMTSHIQKNFRYPQKAIIDRSQGDVWIRFVIDEEGNITNLKALMEGENCEALKQEAIRVISKLAPFQPAIKKGKKVLVKYGFPINFSLED